MLSQSCQNSKTLGQFFEPLYLHGCDESHVGVMKFMMNGEVCSKWHDNNLELVGAGQQMSGVTSGVLRCSQVLLDHRGDCQSVVHSLISCCSKGGPRHWLQLVCCAYLQSGVQVFLSLRAKV